MKRRIRYIALVLTLLVLAALLVVPTAHAFESRGGDKIVITEDEVIDDDLYVGANVFVLEGTINGDLVVGATDITINGTVTGDVWAGGQSVVVNGTVQDDVHAAGAALIIGAGAQIGDDLIAAGYSLEMEPGSEMAGSLIYAGGQGLLAGTVGEDADLAANAIELQGEVEGDVKADISGTEDQISFVPLNFIPNMPRVPSVEPGLTLGEEALIGGTLTYAATEELDIEEGVVAGEVEFQEEPVTPETRRATRSAAVTWLLRTIRRIVALIIVALLLAWLIPALLKRPALEVQARPGPSVGWGALIFFLFPLAVFVLAGIIILLALLLGIISLGNLTGSVIMLGIAGILALVVSFGLAVTYLTKAILGYWGGHFILSRLNSDWVAKPVLVTLVGVVLVALLISIPFLGWIFSLAINLFGLGALWLWLRKREELTA